MYANTNIKEAFEKLKQCQRIDREFKRTHNKLLTVYEAFNHLRTNAVRLDSQTTELLRKLPHLTSDQELHEMRQTVNQISHDVARMDNVFADQGDPQSYATFRQKLVEEGDKNVKKGGGGRRHVQKQRRQCRRRHRGKRRGGVGDVEMEAVLSANDTEDKTELAGGVEMDARLESPSGPTTSPAPTAPAPTPTVPAPAPLPTSPAPTSPPAVQPNKIIAEVLEKLEKFKTSSKQPVTRLYGSGKDALVNHSPFGGVLSELQNARGRVDYTLQFMHRSYNWGTLLDFVKFKADDVYCPCWWCTKTTDANNGLFLDGTKFTEDSFIGKVKEILTEQEFSISNVYLRAQVNINGMKYDIDYYAPIWKDDKILLHVASSSVYDIETKNVDKVEQPVNLEVYYSDTHIFRMVAKGFEMIPQNDGEDATDVKQRVFRNHTVNKDHVNDINDFANKILTQMYVPYLFRVAMVIDKTNNKLRDETQQTNINDTLNQIKTTAQWKECLM